MTLSIVRVVVNGCNRNEGQTDNTKIARRRLYEALSYYAWPAEKVTFVLTPGGFACLKFPQQYDGRRGWDSRKRDFNQLVKTAQEAVRKVATRDVLEPARGRAKYLTLGVDLVGGGGKGSQHNCTTSCPKSCTHAELVVVVEVNSGEALHWTGKSYPVTQKNPPASQEHSLVQAPIKSHFFESGRVRALVLGCHDLTMFNPRNQSRIKHPHLLERRSKMLALATEFEPKVVLHHPHSTDCTRTWCHGWGGVRRNLNAESWASGIAYCGHAPRASLDRILQTTKHGTVSDVVVEGY